MFKSKTVIGVLLGVLGLILDAGAVFPGAPPIVSQILLVVGFVVTTLGLQDAIEQEQQTIVDKVKRFFSSSPGAGALLIALNAVVDNLTDLNLPVAVTLALQIVGAFLVAFGLRQAARRK